MSPTHTPISTTTTAGNTVVSPRLNPSRTLTGRQLHIDAQITDTAEDIVQIINDNETKNFQLGVILIVVAIGSWIIGLELVNSVLKGDDYKKPCLFAWITGSCFMLNLLPDIFEFVKSKWSKSEVPLPNSPEATPLLSPGSASGSTNNVVPKTALEKSLIPDAETPVELTRSEVFSLAAEIAVIYLMYNIFVMFALQFTSASNQTVLGSTTSIFTLFIGRFLNIDKITAKKLICIFVSLGGVFFINWSESGKANGPNDGSKYSPKNPLFGNFLAILGALMYALYLIIMKVRCGTGNKTTNERRLFGFVGIFTFFIGIPLLIIADWQGIEKFEFPPPSNDILISILINGVFSVISDYTTILAMLLTSPLVTSLSLTSAIPITILLDFIILHLSGKGGSGGNEGSDQFMYFFGIGCILVSVVLVNVNITSENELIHEFIDDALEEAIRDDEVLSPVLSPLLSPKAPLATSPFISNSEILQRHAPGITLSTLIQSFSPKIAVSSTNENGPSQGGLPSFQLPQNQNPEFGIDSPTSDGKLLVYGGENHHYHVRNVYANSPEIQPISSNHTA
ncbi:hypothetical protein CAAN1_06S02344 [[Candida] anglica]|uniref:EamA domain-containing protein n=1 Tax=[Candida] anglica TaxID=148631 RepID=A0ABP0ELF7_9ASCO